MPMDERKFYIRAKKGNDFDVDIRNWLLIRSVTPERGGRYRIEVRIRGETKELTLLANSAFKVEFAEGWPDLVPVSWPSFRLYVEREMK